MADTKRPRPMLSNAVLPADMTRRTLSNADITPDDPATITARVRALAQQHVPAAIAALGRIVSDSEAPPTAVIAAANAILDRADGKPTAKVDTTVTTMDVTAMHLATLEALSVGHKGTVIDHE